MNKHLLLLLCVLCLSPLWAQRKYTLSGTITDSASGEKLLGVNVIVKGTQMGATTNAYGFYSLTLPQGDYTLQVAYLGFKTIEETLQLKGNLRRNYKLLEEDIALEGIEITAHSTPKVDIRTPQMSVASIPIQTIKKLPVLVGEVDIIKSLQQLPGVSNAGEASSGFNVRGGAADQNLIMLDQATIFNASHLFGFLSIYNADAIRDMKLYKGGMPARYGGRISSVLDVYQKDGNNTQFHATGGIGVLSSRLLAEGPIVKDKSSFLIGGRASYAHLFLKLTDNNNSAYFYDLNTKLNTKIDDQNSLYLSGYFGRDVFDLSQTISNSYGNALVNLRWNHLFSDQLFSNLSLIYSDYYYGLNVPLSGFKWDSWVRNLNLMYDFKHYFSDRFKVGYGLQGTYYDFNPGKITPIGESTISYKALAHKYAVELGLYAEAEHKLSEPLTLSYGLRWSNFYHLGKRTMDKYYADQAVIFNPLQRIYERSIPIGQKSYKAGELIDVYAHLEPRLSLAYAFDDHRSIKASYARMTQYLHLISNTASPTPLDIWTPSDRYLKPQYSDQVALGYTTNLKGGDYSLETEIFYKTVQNRLDYIDGANLVANESIEREVLAGHTRAYGWEVLLRKNTGKFTGWLSYTYSKSQQQTPGRTDYETGINNGQWYASAYDKPHNLSLTGTYTFNKKWNASAVFTLQSGIPANFPIGKYKYFGVSISNYSARNAYRLPIYHRLDVSVSYTPHPERKWKSEWVFGIYNLYNRYNAASIYFRSNRETQQSEAVKLSIFGIVPSLTYNFSF